MNNYLSDGKSVTLTSPSGGVTTGVGYIIGGMFVVAQSTVAQTLKFSGVKQGVVKLPKDGVSAHTEGEQVFWDNTNKLVKESASGYYAIGHAVKATQASDTHVEVALSNAHITAVP